MEFYEARQGFGGTSPEAIIWTLIQFFNLTRIESLLGSRLSTESLILAQDERWRRA